MSISIVTAKWDITPDPCIDKSVGQYFILGCPADHRVEGDWFKEYHFLNNESLAWCDIDGTLIFQNCSYEIRNWIHPQVSGTPNDYGTIQSKSQQVPEFTTLTAAIALLGAGTIIFRLKKKR